MRRLLFFVLVLGCSNGAATVPVPEETETIPVDVPGLDSGELEDTAG
jgi:hypothetical protein|tara:strand:+ start:85 stop:225 length:141 start_codon:yes stop_codon:yes gene_type:complete